MADKDIAKRKIDGHWHFMAANEYALCGLAFDGEDATNTEATDSPVSSAREITCPDCKKWINAVRWLIKKKESV